MDPRKLANRVGFRQVLRGAFTSIHALEIQRAAMEVAVPLRFTLVAIRSSNIGPCDPSMAGWYRAERSGSELTKSKQLIASCDPELACVCLAARTQFGPAEALQLASLVRDGLDLSGVSRAVGTTLCRTARFAQSELHRWCGPSFASARDDTCSYTDHGLEERALCGRTGAAFQAVRTSFDSGDQLQGCSCGRAVLRSSRVAQLQRPRLSRETRRPIAIVALLEEEGYANSSQFTADQFDHVVAEFKEFVFRRGEFSLEPHWSLTGKRYPFDTDYEGFWQRAGIWNFDGVALRVFAPEDALLVHCLVGAKGRWQRLQMVCDVAECVRACPDMDWSRVNEMSRATGTVRILHVGLLLAAELSGAQLPDDVAVAVRKSPQVSEPRTNSAEFMEGAGDAASLPARLTEHLFADAVPAARTL